MNKKILFAAFFLLSSCTIDNGHFAVISSRPLSLLTISAGNSVIADDIIESTTQHHVAAVIPLNKAPNITAAVNQILDKYQADYLADVTVKYRTFKIAWYSYSSWIIEGDAVRIGK